MRTSPLKDDHLRPAEKDLTNAPTVCDREHLQLLIQRATGVYPGLPDLFG